MKWYARNSYAIVCSLLVSFCGFMWGYDIGAMNGVKEMPGYRAALNVSYTLLSTNDNDTQGQCTSSDDVETSALLGIAVAILQIGCLIGALLAGVLSDIAGRKLAIVSGTVSCIVGVVLHAGGINIWMVLVGRFTGGFGVGILYQVGPVYIAELSPKNLRGRLVSFIAIASATGMLVSTILNTFMEKYWFGWRITLAAQLGGCGVVAIGSIFVPETPRWLVKKGRYTKALHVLKRIHQDEAKAVNDLEEIKASINNTSKVKLLDTIKFLFRWNILQRLSIGFFLQFFGRFNGGVFIAYYSVTLFCRVGVDGFVASVSLFVCMLIAQIAGMVIVDKAGRKLILLVCGLLMSVLALSIATTIILFDLDNPPEDGFYQEQIVAGYLIVILVILFMGTYMMSYGNIPFVVNSEIFPLQVRGITVAITTTGWWGGTIVLNELSAVMISSPLGSYGTFFFIAGFCILMNIYVILLIPETKKKSLEEIESLFMKPWYERINLKSYIWCWLIPCGCHKHYTRFNDNTSEDLQISLSLRTDSSDSINSNTSEHSGSIETNL